MTYEIALQFGEPGYIAKPFWREQKELIRIQKESGFNRLKSEEKRRQTLLAFLEREGHNMQHYEKLQELAKRPFHMTKTAQGSRIVIPPRSVHSFLANVARVAKSAFRAIDHGQVYVAVKVLPPGLVTDKVKPDDVFSRFVKLETSNERVLAEDPSIANFIARGRIEVHQDMVQPKDLLSMIEWGAKYVGIGSARSQGYGRFRVIKFEPVGDRVAEEAAAVA